MKPGLSVARRVLAAFAVVAACALAGGCAFPAQPSLFPSILADPPPRNDTTLSPDQVKQAVDDLEFERKRLCMEAVAEEGAPPPDCETQAGTGATPNTGAPAKP
jgi:hypothetical protein